MISCVSLYRCEDSRRTKSHFEASNDPKKAPFKPGKEKDLFFGGTSRPVTVGVQGNSGTLTGILSNALEIGGSGNTDLVRGS